MPTGFALDVLFDKPGQKNARRSYTSCAAVSPVALTVRTAVRRVRDERMDRVAVCRDRGVADGAVLVRRVVRFDDGRRTAFYSLVKCVIGVLDIKRNIPNAVAVLLDVLGSRMIGIERRRQDKIEFGSAASDSSSPRACPSQARDTPHAKTRTPSGNKTPPALRCRRKTQRDVSS